MAKSELEQLPASERIELPRRRFFTALATAPALALPALLVGCRESEEESVSTNEDLMREHGILKRVLLAYDEVIRRIHSNQERVLSCTLNL